MTASTCCCTRWEATSLSIYLSAIWEFETPCPLHSYRSKRTAFHFSSARSAAHNQRVRTIREKCLYSKPSPTNLLVVVIPVLVFQKKAKEERTHQDSCKAKWAPLDMNYINVNGNATPGTSSSLYPALSYLCRIGLESSSTTVDIVLHTSSKCIAVTTASVN